MNKRTENVQTAKCENGSCKNERNESKVEIILLIISAVLFVLSVVLQILKISPIIIMIPALLCVLLSGYEVIIDGIKSAIKLSLDETTLMTVAVIAAVILGEFVEAAAVTLLFSLGELLEDKAVDKSKDRIKALVDIRPDTATVIVDKLKTKTVPAKEVEIGTLIEIAPHTVIPIDCVVIKGKSFVDTSAITGESLPLECKKGTFLQSGMLNGDSTLYAKTTKTHENSTASKIVELVENSEKNKAESEKLITRFAKIYTPVVMLFALVIAVVPPLIFGDFVLWINRALVCLVSACPCAIVISVPLAYFAGIGSQSKNGILIKGGKFLEILANAKAFVFDKTGTLTENKIVISDIKAFGNYSEDDIIKLASSVEEKSTHPVAIAIKELAREKKIEPLTFENYKEIPSKGVSAVYGTSEIRCFADNNEIKLTIDNKTAGIIKTSDQVRKEAKSVLTSLKKLGIEKIVMLTGDKKDNAEEVAKTLKIDDYSYSLMPQDKLQKVQELKKDFSPLCFVGDGINDAPVMAESDCAIAMGLGSEAAIETADIILSNGDLSPLPKAIKLCRKTMKTVKTNLILALTLKAVVIILAVLGIAPMWLAVLADTGMCVVCVLNSTRLIKT